MDVNGIIKTLYMLKYKKDSIKYHPEENVLSHSIQTFEQSKLETNDKELQMAALFHDIGKIIQGENHPKHSVRILSDFGYSNTKVFQIIDNHMRIRWYLSGRMRKLGKLNKLLSNKYLKEIIMIRRFDKMGRQPNLYVSLNINEVKKLLNLTYKRS